MQWSTPFSYLKHFLSGRANGSYAGMGFSDMLIYAKMVAPGVILQADGSFVAAFYFKGADLESSTNHELEVLSSRLNLAFNRIGSGWMFQVDTIRKRSLGYTDIDKCFFTDNVSKQIDAERRCIYESTGEHYENSYAISFTFKPQIDLNDKLSVFFNRNGGDSGYTRHLENFLDKLNEIKALIDDYLNLRKMSNVELLSYIGFCISGVDINLNLPYRCGMFLKHYLATHDVVNTDNLRIGDKYVKTVSITGFPHESYPGILDKLNYLDFAYRFNTRFIILGHHEAHKTIERISNIWYQKRFSAMDTVKMSMAIDTNIKIDRASNANYHDSQNAQELNDSQDTKFGYYTATVIIMDSSLEGVESRATRVRNLFADLGFSSQIERFHGFEAYLGSLPGYAYANVRKWLINTINVSDIMPCTSIWSGANHNPCKYYSKESPPLFYAKTTGLTPLRLSLHTEISGHTLIIGPSGSGKSTLLNFIIAQHMRYENSRVFVFDKNHGSYPLNVGSGGIFFDLGADDNQIYFQPLAHLESDVDFDFASNWILELCALNGLAVNDLHRSAIGRALLLMKHETPSHRRTLSYFRHLVQDYDKSIANILNGFSSTVVHDGIGVNSGFVAKLFDCNYDHFEDLNNRINSFEMSRLMTQGDRVVIPAISYLIHALSKQFTDNVPTLVIFDESFLFFKHEIFRDKIIEWIKTVRKFNVAIVFATQELTDLFQYETLYSSIKNNCVTKFFLPNKMAESDDISMHYKLMGLNDKQIKLISLLNIGDYFYYSQLGIRKFTLDIKPGSTTFAYTACTSSADIKLAMELKKNCNDVNDFHNKWIHIHSQEQ